MITCKVTTLTLLTLYHYINLFNILVWNGSIFIREGSYKDAILKFEIFIPSNYPSKSPEVVFITKIFHPLIDLVSGKLDISKKFPVWEPGKNFILQILYFIQNIFFDRNYLQEENSFNNSAAKLFQDDIKKFEEEVSKYCRTSYNNRFDTANKDVSLKFSKFNNLHELILNKILKQNKEVIIIH